MHVDLRKPALVRWTLSAEQTVWTRELLTTYQRDLGLSASLVSELSRPVIHQDYWNEMEGLAARAKVPLDEVVCGNLYYDALKAVLVGCTAFAVDTPTGPLHARNLDWWTENDSLRRYTIATRFIGAATGEFTTIGWPGFVGVLSGIAPGRFAITLNAVVSDEPGQAATPVVFLLRQVLEEAPDFLSALQTLQEVPLASDSLLLLTGTQAGEMAVIERTPSRAKVRYGEKGRLFVTNDYQVLQTGGRRWESEWHATACRRYDRIAALVASQVPQNADDCLHYLNDAHIRMGITVQQMVFQASTGLCVID